jgi:hypothetical protein
VAALQNAAPLVPGKKGKPTVTTLPDIQITCYLNEETDEWHAAVYVSFGPMLLSSKFFKHERRNRVLLEAVRWATYRQDAGDEYEEKIKGTEYELPSVQLDLLFFPTQSDD